MAWVITTFDVINDMKIQSDHKIDPSLFWSCWSMKWHMCIFATDSKPGVGVDWRGEMWLRVSSAFVNSKKTHN